MLKQAYRLWAVTFGLFLAMVVTIRFPPYVVWDLPVAVRIGLATAVFLTAVAAAVVSRRAGAVGADGPA